MKKNPYFILIACLLLACEIRTDKEELKNYLERPPSTLPAPFKYSLTPKNKLIHKGIYSPDLSAYYYTISDKSFKQFDVKVIHKIGNDFKVPIDAFFNSQYSEHGMSFSSDGKTLYFSSTRPVDSTLAITNTWHLWRSHQVNGEWATPEFIDMPNLRNKLQSHPTVTNGGELYFHASKLNYSEMQLYVSKEVDGKFQAAELVDIPLEGDKCTPYISPDGHYLIFALIGEPLKLYLTYRDDSNGWQKPILLPERINKNGQGNPWVTPDQKYLFYTVENDDATWQVNWVNIQDFLAKHLPQK